MTTRRRAAGAADRLRQKLRSHEASIGVIGLGYVGLPLALEFVRAGFTVHGIDVDARRVEALARGRSHIEDVPGSLVRKSLADGRFVPTTGFDVLSTVDAVIVCVPTPLRKTRDPDISYIVSALDEIAPRVHAGMLIVLESTSYPGTTEEVLLPRLQESGLKAGRDFFLAFSPERVDPGNKSYGIRNTPKVVGGMTAACGRVAAELYAQAVDTVVPVSSARAAEMIKLLENTFRSVNIGMVNEIALICDRLQLDVWEIINAAGTKPFGFMRFYPGPGLGGHCIPIDPHYLSWKLRTLDYHARFIELASEVNGQMPNHVLSRVVDALNKRRKSLNGAKILLVGVAYKKDTSDTRESPALDLMRLLVARGAKVRYHDPFVPALTAGAHGPASKSVALSAASLRPFDCVVIVTNHSAIDYQKVVDGSRIVVDTRDATRGIRRGRSKVVGL